MDPVTVRRYRPTDAAAVWDVHVRDLSAMLPVFSSTWATDLHDVERHYLPRGDFLVAEDGDRVVATGGYLPVDDDTTRLTRVRVLPRWRDGDVCDHLLAELESSARRRDYERVILDSNDLLTTRNRLLDVRGYELVGREPLPEWCTDLLYFQKAL